MIKRYDYRVNHPVPVVGRVIGNGELRCLTHSTPDDQEVRAKDTYSDGSCAVCLKPLMFMTKVFTRFADGSTTEQCEVNTALICGFTGKARGGVIAQEILEYTVLNEV